MPAPSHFVYAQQSYRLSWYVCIDNAAAFSSLCLYTISDKHVKPNQVKLPLLMCVLFVSSHGWTLVVSLCCVTKETWVFLYVLEV
jgi:branched-subunit amino acid transport protein AzlD